MTVRFLHMGHASRRNQDIWQVFTGEKCKKKINFYQKVQKRVIFCTRSNAASFIAFSRASALEAISSKMTTLCCRSRDAKESRSHLGGS
jgi:hypothetical protein